MSRGQPVGKERVTNSDGIAEGYGSAFCREDSSSQPDNRVPTPIFRKPPISRIGPVRAFETLSAKRLQVSLALGLVVSYV